ncbi:hypothetical protein AAE478_003461 [Parahypoxylon ruwenzoriense]
MWLSPKRRRVITIIPQALLLATRALGQADASAPIAHDVARSALGIPSAEPTCESRTVNYITHTLPQQCLTASPSPLSTLESVSATITSSPTVVESVTPGATDDDATIAHHELDADGNDLSTGAFMSFEQWKAMMLEKSGQDALEPRHRKTKDTSGGVYPGEDFDSLGDEGEVSFDFDAYSDRISEITSATRPSQRGKEIERQDDKVTYDEGLAQGYRSKDAGKTCKERFSYASFDAGATIKKASPGAKNPKAILVENKDSYMLLECAMQNKFFVVELSDDILVDTVVLANFEFFSSMLRRFRVSVSDRYPVKSEKWKILGTFEARNSRDIQPFLVENPQIWARYLRIEILSHYGNEYYCPVSLLRVHGTRMLDSWKEADPADLEVEDDGTKAISEAPEETVEVADTHPEAVEVAEPAQPENQTVNLEQSDWVPYWNQSYFSHNYPINATCAETEADYYKSKPENEDYKHGTSVNAATTEQAASTDSKTSSSGAMTSQSAGQTTIESANSVPPSSSGDMSMSTVTANVTDSAPTMMPPPESRPATVTRAATPTTITPPGVGKSVGTQSASKSKSAASTSIKPPSSRSAVSKGQQQPSGSPTAPRNKTTTTTSATPAPTVQDSFFKALTKRLQTLESNTTLSLQYIESQSKFLQEALARLEKRQVAKVDLFLDTLNKTVLGELREVRTQYDQIWQSTVIALETQREQSEREIVALSSRLGVLADEVVFQKRMAIFQSVLLLGCLFIAVFSRGGANGIESYYPSQLLSSSGDGSSRLSYYSRLASPIFPSTPKTRQHLATKDNRSHQHNSSNPLLSVIEDSSPLNNGAPHKQHPESDTRFKFLLPSLPLPPPPPSPSRAATDPVSAAGINFSFRPATPSSISSIPDAGYDSEPAMTTTPTKSRDSREYFPAATAGATAKGNAMGDDGGDDTAARKRIPPAYPGTLARRSERQLTPPSEADGVEYVQSSSSRPALAHIASVRKPLPALPEDPD